MLYSLTCPAIRSHYLLIESSKVKSLKANLSRVVRVLIVLIVVRVLKVLKVLKAQLTRNTSSSVK